LKYVAQKYIFIAISFIDYLFIAICIVYGVNKAKSSVFNLRLRLFFVGFCENPQINTIMSI
jgi:hypothetical protein